MTFEQFIDAIRNLRLDCSAGVPKPHNLVGLDLLARNALHPRGRSVPTTGARLPAVP